ncbi:MAG TPA: hypothetical protein VKD19_04175 [Pseudolabrys sp.]|nr:hypothetical protein [Pseudolabrys sp.]
MSSQVDALRRPSDADVQDMLAKAVRLYAERATERDGAFPAFASDAVTATEVMVTVAAMLSAVNLQIFELGMWQAWSGR